MNKQRLRDICRKVSNETGLSHNSVQIYYFLECILNKLANSKYKDKFIFKGGFLLSSVLGLDTRSTMDIDFLIK